MSEKPVLRGEHLWKVYRSGKKSLEVLKGVSIEAARGELVAILGPSGAGKSTLLNLLSGLDTPSRGRVWLGDRELSRLRERERARIMNVQAGFVFQFYHLLGDLTALENVMLPARIRGAGAGPSRDRAERLLDDLGLTDRAEHFPSELSGGEQQRVAIARALMNDPPVLFCDEPTGNLDSKTGASVCAYLARLVSAHQKTVLIVTHDDKIAQSADRILELRDGKWAEEPAWGARRPA
jgi:ABC-type lipoprotein export system ATPase subunit